MNQQQDHTLTLTKTVRTTPERAYRALTDPKDLSTWFTKDARVDLRVGGRYSNADHDTGEYLELDPPNRLKFTWDNAEHCPGTVVEITVTPLDTEHVEILLSHTRLASEAHVDDMKLGWSWALDSAASFLETGKPISFEKWQESKSDR